MLFIAVSPSDQAYGMMTLIAAVIDLILSIVIIKRAVKQKVTMLYVFFLTIFFTSVSYWQVVYEYIYWIFTGNLLPYGFLTEVNLIGVIVSFIAWLYIYMKLVHDGKLKLQILILMLYGIISIAFFMYVLYYLHLAPEAPVKSMLGYEITAFMSDASDIVLIFSFILLFTVLATGLHFSIKSMRVLDNPEVQWKGKFLFISFILYFFGEMDFMSMFLGLEFAVIARLILILSTILFYIGFIMPDFMKKLLNLKDQ